MAGNKLARSGEIHDCIYSIRGMQVMVDGDLADLYRVDVKALNQAVKRNIERFPSKFMFQLSSDEHDSLRLQSATWGISQSLRSQFVTLNKDGRTRPHTVTPSESFIMCTTDSL
jgi:hypothetical protein